MRKRFTKIICVTTAVISALCVGLTAGCNDYSYTQVTDKDTSKVVSGTNGGFSVETGDYVYFINGKTNYTEDNTFGSVVKGSIQRISKSNLSARKYTSTETIVPLIAYSGNYDSGIYIYDGNIYYTTPSIDKNSDGEIQSQKLEFKSSSIDGSSTMGSYYYQASSNTIEYRYVQVDGTVYLLYVLSESLYGTSTTNIHSVNTKTGTNTLLAYNVDSYVFDSEDLENPYVYYTMSVTNYLGSDNTISEEYNQVYRVKADVTTSPREYNFDDVETDDEDDPVYLNYGEFILDGIGIIAGNNQDRVTQFNYNYEDIKQDKYKSELDHSDYTYELEYYKNGRLILTRSETVGGSDSTSVYSIKDDQVKSTWDAIKANNTSNENSVDLFLSSSSDIEYNFITMNGVEKVVYEGSDGIYIGQISDGKLSTDDEVSYIITEVSSPEILAIRQEKTSDGETHWYAYYNGTPKSGTAGYYRIAIDGSRRQYERNKYPIEENLAYTDVALLDIAVASSWYSPEFVDGQLLFASSTEGYSSYNYIMALDLRSSDGSSMMTNKELKGYNEQYNAVFDKIDAYDSVENSDGTSAYENLSNALTYLFYAGADEANYLNKLVTAYQEIEGQDEEYIYSKDSVNIYSNYFANASDEWTFENFKTEMSLSDSYAYTSTDKTINDKTIKYNTQAYYYSVVGQVDEDDADAIIETLRSGNSISDYPEEEETWWESLSTVAKVFFVIGMVVAGLVVIAAAIVLYIFIKKRKAKKAQAVVEEKMAVDITDEDDIDVYTEETNEEHTAEIESGAETQENGEGNSENKD